MHLFACFHLGAAELSLWGDTSSDVGVSFVNCCGEHLVKMSNGFSGLIDSGWLAHGPA